MLANPECDAGDILSQAVVELSGSETSTILKDYLAEVGGSLLLDILPYYLAGELKPKPQDHKKATFTRMFKKEDGEVFENTPALEVDRKIRAFDQWPKVYIEVKGKRVQILAAHFDENGCLEVDRVKPEGKKEMSAKDFENGYRHKLTFS
jgi:methionyl-tRNA formyltransferase